jgi:hypothetical protein
MGTVGELARASTRAHDGVANDARGWLCDAAATLPAPDGTATHPEQEQERASTPSAHFSEAQAEQALWQEFRDHGASLNSALNEALRIHTGPTWRVFQVHIFLLGFGVYSLPSLSRFFHACASSDSASPLPCSLVTRVGGPSSGEARPPRPTELQA